MQDRSWRIEWAILRQATREANAGFATALALDDPQDFEDAKRPLA